MKFKKIESQQQSFYKPKDNNRVSVGNNNVLFWNSGIYGQKNDNAFPDFLIDVAEGGAGTSIHSNIINLKSNLITGDNLSVLDPDLPNAKQTSDFITKRNRRGENLMTSYAFNARQFSLFEQAYVMVVYSKDFSKVAETYAIPVKDVRASALDSLGNIPSYYVSKRWSDISKSAYRKASVTNMATQVPPYTGIKEAKRLEQPVQILHIRRPDYNDVYVNPSYMGGMQWVLISNYVSQFHSNNFKNNYMIQGMLVTYGNMSEDEEKQFSADVEELFMGDEEGQKKMMLANVENKEMTPAFVSAQNMMQDGQYESLIKEANTQVVAAHNCFGILVGIESGSKLGDNGKMINTALQAFRLLTTDPLKNSLVAGYNQIMEDLGYASLDVNTSKMVIEDQVEPEPENINTPEGQAIEDQVDETPES